MSNRRPLVNDTFLHSTLGRVAAAIALVALVLLAYVLVARPYVLHWGATEQELSRAMPGDDLDPTPGFLATRAITINATPAEIWPWLLQMGYGRAGFYGYDILENIGSPRGIRSADQILPEFQRFAVGDSVPISSVATMVFGAIEPDRYLIWSGASSEDYGGFTWALYPIDAHQTRLVNRIRWSFHSLTQPGLLFLDAFTEFTDHLAVREILQGVRDRAEGTFEPMWQQNAEFAVYCASALIFFLAIALVLVRPLTRMNWCAALAAGAGWLITWYVPVPFWAGILLEVAVVWGLWRARPRSAAGSIRQEEIISS